MLLLHAPVPERHRADGGGQAAGWQRASLAVTVSPHVGYLLAAAFMQDQPTSHLHPLQCFTERAPACCVAGCLHLLPRPSPAAPPFTCCLALHLLPRPSPAAPPFTCCLALHLLPRPSPARPALPCPASHMTVSQALKRIDSEGVLFFTGGRPLPRRVWTLPRGVRRRPRQHLAAGSSAWTLQWARRTHPPHANPPGPHPLDLLAIRRRAAGCGRARQGWAAQGGCGGAGQPQRKRRGRQSREGLDGLSRGLAVCHMDVTCVACSASRYIIPTSYT